MKQLFLRPYEHLIVLMRNLYTGQEAIVQTEHIETGWPHVSKEMKQGHMVKKYEEEEDYDNFKIGG